MPVTFTSHDDLHLAVCHCTGLITVEGVVSACRAYHASPAFDPDQPILVVQQRIALDEIMFEQIRQIVHGVQDLLTARGPEAQTVMCCDNAVAYGVARMYEAASAGRSHRRLQIVRDPAEALACLGFDPQDARLRARLWGD